MEAIENRDVLAAINRMREYRAHGQVKPIGVTNPTTSKFEDLEKRGIYKRYWHSTFAEIEQRGIPGQVRSEYSRVKNYAAHMAENVENGVGMILKGPVGTMKTSLAVAILQQYLQEGGSGLFVPMANLLDNLFTMKESNRAEWVAYEEKIRSTGILILDDLGAEYHQEWVISKVDAIISERYNRMRPIIVTTNMSAAEIKGKYAERIYDRLKSTSLVINFDGASLREAVV